MKYTINYTLAGTSILAADTKEEAEFKLKEYLRDNGINLRAADFNITDILEEDVN